MTLRTRLAGKISALGAWLQVGLLDLAVAIEPRLVMRQRSYRARPLLGAFIVVLLALGVAASAGLAIEATSAVVTRLHREDAP